MKPNSYGIRKKTKTYNYGSEKKKQIQQNYGQGWEDVSFYETGSDFISSELSWKTKVNSKGKTIQIRLITHDLEEYRLLGYPTRIIKRKELNN